MKITVIGLGEAGRVFSHGFAERGATVTAFDPAIRIGPPGVTCATSTEIAVLDADIVLSTVGSAAAETVAGEALPHMMPGRIFADLNTSSPEQKLRVASRAHAFGVLFADVAIMAPVTRAGIDTPCLVSGSGADRFGSLRDHYGVSLEYVGTEAGAAARLKLLRSVFMKGLAALVFESMAAADASNSAAWMRAQIVGEFGGSGDELVARLVEGTRIHAARREQEMLDARAYLATLDSPTWITDATVNWLRRIAADAS